MSGNIKITENKTGDDSTETENSEKYKSKKISEPSLDKLNQKDMKITLPLSQIDDHKFSKTFLDYHKNISKLLRRKKQRQYPNL